jgi:hypothetical protein
MFITFFFAAIILVSLGLVIFIVAHGVRNKMVTPIFGMVLIVCSVAVSTWTVGMIFQKVPAMLVSAN